MTIDIRAKVTCSLGRLISASLSDDYIQTSGLIKTSGSCVISGLITPDIGSKVTFQYTKAGLTRTVPRTMRVLSYFADPFRRTTTVQLGCKLTFLSDLSDPINWDAFDDPRNSQFERADQEIVVVPISAQSIAEQCLAELGLTATGLNLTNSFSIASFEFNRGYVNILGDLLVSECLCGYLDPNEVLRVFSLDQQGGSGPLLNQSNLIDVGGIGTGQLPAETVVVRYSTLKLKDPDTAGTNETPKINWEFSSGSGPPSFVSISGVNRNGDEVTLDFSYVPSSSTASSFDAWDRIVSRTTSETSIVAAVNGALVSAQIGFPGGRTQGGRSVLKTTTTSYSYKIKAPPLGSEEAKTSIRPEGYDELVSESTVTTESIAALLGSASIEYQPGDRVSGSAVSEVSTTTYSTGSRNVAVRPSNIIGSLPEDPGVVSGGEFLVNYGNVPVTLSSTSRQIAYGRTSAGGAAMSTASAEGASLFSIRSIARRLVSAGGETNIQTGREVSFQTRPGAADRAIENLAAEGDPNNGYRVQSTAQIELSLGSREAQRRIEFSMPFAPDDIFVKSGTGETATFSAIASDAPAKAARFGRVQNRILLGNRSGMNVQVSPELMPPAPFSAVFINARQLTGLYRLNGTTWTMDANGIVSSTDALFWGVAGAG